MFLKPKTSIFDPRRQAREAQRDQEINAGRQTTRKAMAEGIVQQLMEELYKQHGTAFVGDLDSGDPNVRNWTVTISMANYSAVFFEENFFDFPSDTLRAQLMLVCGK